MKIHVALSIIRTVDEKEEGASFVGHRARNHRLACARRTVQQHTCKDQGSHGRVNERDT